MEIGTMIFCTAVGIFLGVAGVCIYAAVMLDDAARAIHASPDDESMAP